ncbi:transposase [Methylomonas sp. MK1]|uniref:transposase n=1 Tax=Methylomonas sp. MK1 TaxID=1131552 RepID=UPI00038283E3|nr:transposase [Methylomonas sp. MK1]
MLETKSALSRRLVIGHRCDGRCRYDPIAKRELVQSCLQPGVSIARKALEHGINANLLRKWINHYQAAARDTQADELVPPLPAFVPVLTPVIKSQTCEAMLSITLVNGVQMTLQAIDLAELSPLLNTLAHLPCSASTRG